MSLRRLKLTVAYDGTDFVGWQRQNNGPSIQGEIETAVARMVVAHTHVQGAGRSRDVEVRRHQRPRHPHRVAR